MIIPQLLACAIAQPFAGPGYADGAVTVAPDGPFLVAATQATPAAGEEATFGNHVDAIQATLDAMDVESGLVGYSLRGEIGGRDNWTLTVWTSEAAMLDFVLSDAHTAAMTEAEQIVDIGRFVHWEESDPAAIPPDWESVLDRLETTAQTFDYGAG